MPKLSRRPINLNVSFSDSTNAIYSVGTAESLRLWARMTESSPTNLADRTSLTTRYVGAPATSKKQIGFNLYDTVAFAEADSTHANVTSTSGLLSFSTAGDGGTPTATTDQPFSVSVWTKMDSASGVNEFFFAKNGPTAGSDVEYTAYLSNTGKIYFVLHDTAAGAWQSLNTTTSIPANGYVLGKWNHVVFTYDGRGGTGASTNTANQGMSIYINGAAVSATTSAYSGGYYGMQPGYSNPLYIGASKNSTEELTADFAEFAVWGLELSPGSVLALWNATRTMFYDLISGYTDNPPRTVLNSRDNATGSYPSILRTTGFKISNPTDPFNDTRTINFLTSSNITYPFVLDTSDTERYKSNWVSTPNFLEGLSGVTGIVKPFVSDQGLSPSVHQSGEYSPFDESRIYIGTSQFYLTGTDMSVVPGFRSPLDDKVQIKIDIPSTSAKLMSRYMSRGMTGDFSNNRPADPQFVGTNYTGMRYYNFNSAVWDQVGYDDPGTGETIPQTSWFNVVGIDADPPAWNPGHGMPKFKTYQFAMSPQLGYMATDMDHLKSMGYAGIGSPTVSGAAPYSGSYHAKDDQLLSMSDYISHPFVLEKAVLEIPILARTRIGNPYGSDATLKANNSNRDIDNYVFFVYRQRNPTVPDSSHVDSPTYCSGSDRYLVMSASMAFYNSRVFNETIRTEISSSGLLHSPSFSHDFDFAISGSDGAAYGGYAEFNPKSSVRVTMSPAVPSAYRAGGSRFPTRASSTTGQTHWPTLVVQDYWPGGTTFPKPSRMGEPLPGSRGYQNTGNNAGDGRMSQSLQWGNSIHVAYNLTRTQENSVPKGFDITDFRPLRNPAGYGDLSPTYISDFYPSPHRLATVGGVTWNGITISSIGSSCDSPYILFPEDKLVFGLDAGISMVPALGTSNPNFSATDDRVAGFAIYQAIGSAMSASYLQIKTGPASLTLFGSFVKQGREKLSQLNQNLTSDAIHEDLHYSNTVLDQYQIEPRTSYTGSYIDDLVIGVMDRQNNTGGDGIKNVFAQNIPNTITRYSALSLGSGTGSISQFYAESDYRITKDPYGLASWNMKLKQRVVGGFFRNVRHFSPTERSYDTIMPEIIDFGQRSGMELTSSLRGPGWGSSKALLVTYQGNLNEATDLDGVTHKKAYPYSTRKERKLYTDVTLVINAVDANETVNDGTYYSYKNHMRTSTQVPMSQPDAVKAMLFKSGITITFRGGTKPALSNKYFPVWPPGRFMSLAGSFTGPLYPVGAQSFLYGIENTSPLRSSAVFRSDRYGQFRDMLEQRKDRRYFNRKTKRATDAVIECQFVSSSDGMTVVEPHATRSSNLSQWSTSSMPFFDEVDRYPNGRNRPALQRFRGISIFLGTGRRRSIFTS